MNKGIYQLEIKGDRLMLRTLSFRPEKGSILHSGIYNRELASILAASVIGGSLFAFLSLRLGSRMLIYFIAIFIFTAAFLFFRTVVFKESFLEMCLDKSSGRASIVIKEPFKTSQRNFSIASIKDLVLGYQRFNPENPEGVAVVERIALQHGTVIPGFGEGRDFYNIELSFEDRGKTERILVFTTEKKAEAVEIIKGIKDFLGRRDVNSI